MLMISKEQKNTLHYIKCWEVFGKYLFFSQVTVVHYAKPFGLTVRER